MYRIFRSDCYDKKLKKISKSEIRRIKNFEQQLKKEPFNGKPLGYKFFREKKFGGKRLLFLVYEEHAIVFFVTITDKKAQQRDINIVVSNLDIYKEEIDKLAQKLRLP